MRSCSTQSVSPQVPRIAPGGLIARASRKVPLENGRLRLAPELFVNDALCFLDAASTDVAYVNGRGQAIEISVEDFPHVALWTKPGAPFLCIECWTGHSDPEGFEGDIFDKPSMRSSRPARARAMASPIVGDRLLEQRSLNDRLLAMGDPLTYVLPSTRSAGEKA